MPIKEIITFAFGVIGTLVVLHGPLHLNEESIQGDSTVAVVA